MPDNAAPDDARSTSTKSLGGVHLSLQQFVLLALLLICMPGVVVSGWVAYRNVKVANDEFIRSQARQMSEQIEDDLAALFDDAVQLVALNSALSRAGLLDLGQPEQLLKHLGVQARQYPKVTMLGIGFGNGEYHAINHPQFGKETSLLADRALIANGRELHICRVDEADYSCAFLEREMAYYDARERPWFKRAIAVGQIVWNSPYFYPEESWGKYGLMGIGISAPLIDAAGEVLAVLGVSISLDHLGKLLHSHADKKGGVYFIAESEGDLLAQSTSDPIYVSQGSKPIRKNIFASDDPLIRSASAFIKTTGLPSGEGTINSGGDAQQIHWRSHTLLNGPTLIIGVLLPQSQFDQISRETIRTIIGLTLVFMLLGVLISVLAARWMSRPITTLNHFSQRIAVGDFTAPSEQAVRIEEIASLNQAMQSMADELQQKTWHLEQLVRERTAQLEVANQQLHDEMAAADRARQQADEATYAKSKFLAAASHDLRQPAQAQGLFLEALSRTDLTPHQRKLLENVRAASNASVDLLNTLLDFSRIESGVIVPKRQDFDLQTLFNRIEAEFGSLADAKNLVYRTRESHHVVYSDPALVALILRNLVANAIRYTERGGLLIASRRRHDRVLLEVWDTGVGIAPEHHQDVFREFLQLANPERDRNKGLGLGLAIVDGLVKCLGHELTFRSRPGQGSVFRLALPVGTGTPPEAVVTKWDHEPHRCNVRVLVIDDDPAIRSGLQLLITDWGCLCDVAETIEEALVLARQSPPAVIISDYRLRNGETGTAAIAALRAACASTLPALLITGETAREQLSEAFTEGVPILHKPVQPEELRRQLEALLA